MFGQMQTGAPMQGGAGKGGIQQPMGGGGKGGMNRGPGGNAQNNPGGYPPGMMPGPNMPGNPINSFPGGNAQNNPGMNVTRNSVGQATNPYMSRFAQLGQQFNGLGSAGLNQTLPMQSFGGWGNDVMPSPQLRPDVTQVQIAPSPQPQFNSAGLPAGGLLAKLYGGS